MTKVLTSRVPDGLAAWCGEYAEKREVTRAVIVEAALEHFRGLCESGVPDLPEARGQGRPKKVETEVVAEPPSRPEASVLAPDGSWNTVAMERQRRLNEMKYGRSS